MPKRQRRTTTTSGCTARLVAARIAPSQSHRDSPGFPSVAILASPVGSTKFTAEKGAAVTRW